MKTSESSSLFSTAQTLFPGGVNSPVRAFRSVGGTPLFIRKGKGSKIWDADENEYIDFCCSWGPLIHGHAHPNVVKAIKDVAENGTSFGAPNELENELASLIISNHPFIEKLRFVSSGTEAVMSAIRMARGYTGRNKVIKFEGCYHGHSDSLLVKAGSGLVTLGNSSSSGVPKSFTDETIVCPLNNENALKEAFQTYKGQIACVIIEPVPANNGLLIQRKEYLQFLRNICTEQNALLIFDEVITGFRLGFTGAAGHYNIKPDIITFGKIIGGGLPVGAYASSSRIMSMIAPEGKVYQAGTLSGNPVAMAAGIAQLKLCLEKDFYPSLEQKTTQFISQAIALAGGKKGFHFQKIGSIFWLAFSEKQDLRTASEIDPECMKRFATFYHQLLENRVYLGPSGYEVGFVSSAHTMEDLSSAATVFASAV